MPYQPRARSELAMAYRGGGGNDIFAVNPLRRSAWIVGVSWALILGPAWLLDGDAQSVMLIAFGWLAMTGIVMVTPILIWCLVEEGVKAVRRRRDPTTELLDLSPRAVNLLRRHGFETIAQVERTPDSTLALLSNMDASAIREIRRAVSIWRYQRWQERGFPADDLP